MFVVHDRPKAVFVPLERLRFAPDPLDFNGAGGECDCLKCQLRRDIAKQMGVPPAAIVGMTLAPVGQSPTLKVQGPKLQPLTPPPVITAFDVHGAPDRSVGKTAAVDSFALPCWVRRAAMACALVIGCVYGLYRLLRIVLGCFRASTRTRLRLVKEDS